MKLFTFFILLLCSSICFGQNPYYDAIHLKKYGSPSITKQINIDATADNFIVVSSILSKYLSEREKLVLDSINIKIKELQTFKDTLDSSRTNEKLKIDSANNILDGSFQAIFDIIESELDNNPFISLAGTVQDAPLKGIGSFLSASSSLSTLGGLNVTTFTDELSQFLIDRAKQELNIAFFKHLKKFFDETPEIRVLFPKTSDVLENLLSYQYTIMIGTLRNSFQDDLEDVFFKTDDVFKLPKYRPFIEEFPEVILSLKTIQIIAQIDNQRHPADILGDFKNIPEWEEFNERLSDPLYNFYAALQISHMFSQSLRYTSFGDTIELKRINENEERYIIQIDTTLAEAIKKPDGSYGNLKSIREFGKNRAWISRQQLNYLIQDPVAFKIYLGLLYQQSINENITYKTKSEGTKSFHDVLADNKESLYLIRDYLVELIELSEEVDNILKEIKEKEGNRTVVGASKDELHRYINTGIDLIEYATDVSYLFQDAVSFEPYLNIARNGNDMYLNLTKKEYAPAVNNLTTVLELIVLESRKNKGAIEQANSLLETQITSAKTEKKNTSRFTDERSDLKKKIKGLEDQRSFEELMSKTSKILKYGTFMANIVQSDSAEEVRAAIEAAALPVGSYTIKRYSRWNFSLNAYLGASYGNEKLRQAPDGKEWSRIVGVHAPIGITCSYGLLRGNGKTVGSVSAFLTVLDIGAVTQFRLQNPKEEALTISGPADTTSIDVTQTTSFDELPEIKLENIFAPGFYLVYGIASLPISVGGGLQYGPALREINIKQKNEVNQEILTTNINSSAWSWRVFIAVDIPLINLYTKSK